MQFQYDDDREYLQRLLCEQTEDLATYAMLFDFRPPRQKRVEFDRLRAKYLAQLLDRFGRRCMLQIATDCDVNSGLQVDHIIPLSSNVLNKLLRSARASRSADGRLLKAVTQSLGSNHIRNLTLTCHNCNSAKKNQLLSPEVIRWVLAEVKSADS